MSLPNSGALALILTLAGSGAVAGPSYLCKLKPISGAAWIPSRITVQFEDDFTEAEVTDASFGVSVPAKVTPRSGTSYAFSWSLPGLAVSTEQGQAEPRFRAVLNTANQKMSIQSVRTGDGNLLPRGSGNCETERALSHLAQIEGGREQTGFRSLG
ncbi:MAG: hypothetical protein AB3N24_16340, partial [Leisingera sp.]